MAEEQVPENIKANNERRVLRQQYMSKFMTKLRELTAGVQPPLKWRRAGEGEEVTFGRGRKAEVWMGWRRFNHMKPNQEESLKPKAAFLVSNTISDGQLSVRLEVTETPEAAAQKFLPLLEDLLTRPGGGQPGNSAEKAKKTEVKNTRAQATLPTPKLPVATPAPLYAIAFEPRQLEILAYALEVSRLQLEPLQRLGIAMPLTAELDGRQVRLPSTSELELCQVAVGEAMKGQR